MLWRCQNTRQPPSTAEYQHDTRRLCVLKKRKVRRLVPVHIEGRVPALCWGNVYATYWKWCYESLDGIETSLSIYGNFASRVPIDEDRYMVHIMFYSFTRAWYFATTRSHKYSSSISLLKQIADRRPWPWHSSPYACKFSMHGSREYIQGTGYGYSTWCKSMDVWLLHLAGIILVNVDCDVQYLQCRWDFSGPNLPS